MKCKNWGRRRKQCKNYFFDEFTWRCWKKHRMNQKERKKKLKKNFCNCCRCRFFTFQQKREKFMNDRTYLIIALFANDFLLIFLLLPAMPCLAVHIFFLIQNFINLNFSIIYLTLFRDCREYRHLVPNRKIMP